MKNNTIPFHPEIRATSISGLKSWKKVYQSLSPEEKKIRTEQVKEKIKFYGVIDAIMGI